MTPRSFHTVEIEEISPESKDRFRLWVKAYNTRRLARSLNINFRNVNLWIQPCDPDIPRLATAQKIIAISTKVPLNIGPLTYEDIFGAVTVKSHTAHPYKSMISPRQIPTRRAY